jgi:hypothetical protein
MNQNQTNQLITIDTLPIQLGEGSYQIQSLQFQEQIDGLWETSVMGGPRAAALEVGESLFVASEAILVTRIDVKDGEGIHHVYPEALRAARAAAIDKDKPWDDGKLASVRWRELRVDPEKMVYGIQYAGLGPAIRWIDLLELAAADLGVGIEYMDHIHAGYEGGVEHAQVNHDSESVDFDTTHRFAFAGDVPSCYESVSIDLAHQ